MIKISIDGFDEVLDFFKKYPEKVLKNTDIALNKSAVEVEGQIVKQIKAKGINDTGKMSQSVSISKPGRLSVLIEVKSKYAPYVENGTPPHAVSAAMLKGWAGRKLGNPNLAWAVAKSIKQKGTKPKYFFRDAVTNSLGSIQKYFNEIIINSMER